MAVADDDLMVAEMTSLRREFPHIEDALLLVLAEAKVFPLEPF